MPVAAWELYQQRSDVSIHLGRCISSGAACRFTCYEGGWCRGHGCFQQDIERGEICGRTKEKSSGMEEKNHCRKK